MKIIITTLLLAITISYCKPASAQVPPNMQKITAEQKIAMSESLAVDMVDRYKKKRYNRVRKFPVVGERYDSKSFWYSIDQLKNVIKKAEALNDANKKTDGIRIYFGVYPKNTVYRIPGKAERLYSKLHTLLFVPTTKMACEEGDAYGDCHLDRTYPSVTDTNNAGDNQNVVLLNLEIKDDGSVVVDNHGELCPPPNPCSGTLLIERAALKKKIKTLSIN